MNLTVKDVLQCENFGVPTEDTTDEAIITSYLARGWDKEQAARHLQCAIDAGAYSVKRENDAPIRVSARRVKEVNL